jgi:hypothetical protein
MAATALMMTRKTPMPRGMRRRSSRATAGSSACEMSSESRMGTNTAEAHQSRSTAATAARIVSDVLRTSMANPADAGVDSCRARARGPRSARFTRVGDPE